jgi:hypothetical protein
MYISAGLEHPGWAHMIVAMVAARAGIGQTKGAGI